MREIEFRAKRTDNNKWVYGHYVQGLDFENKPINSSIVRNITTINPVDKTIKQDIYEVDINTLGQYTGLKDKNDTKVFESDIIRMHYFFENYDPSSLGAFEDEAEIIGVVKCDLIDGFYVETVDDHSRCYLQWIEEPTEELEVLGNIYDNPEWLEGENND